MKDWGRLKLHQISANDMAGLQCAARESHGSAKRISPLNIRPASKTRCCLKWCNCGMKIDCNQVAPDAQYGSQKAVAMQENPAHSTILPIP
jgi:hypothetical protein